jgi:hypothetical protein
MQGAYSRSHAWSANQCVQKARDSQLMSCSTLILFYMCSAVYKTQGAPDRRPVLLLYFLHVQRRVQKARGSRSTSRSTLILFTRTTSCTKSKELTIDVPFHSYTFYTHSATYKNKGLSIDFSFYSYTFYMHNATYKKHGAPDNGVSILHIPIATMEVAQDQFATRQVGLGQFGIVTTF